MSHLIETSNMTTRVETPIPAVGLTPTGQAAVLAAADGHEGENSNRDYLIEVRQAMGGDADAILRRPVLATSRVRDFWGGVYKTFAVAGPSTYFVRIGKNASLNVIVSAVMVDRLVSLTPEQEEDEPRGLPLLFGLDYRPKSADDLAGFTPAGPLERWKTLDSNGLKKQTLHLRREAGLQFYRWAAQDPQCNGALEAWRWPLHLWTPSNRTTFTATARQGREKFAKFNNIPVERE